MPVLRKQNIKIATTDSLVSLDLKLGEIGTDGQNIFIGKIKGNVSLTFPVGVIMSWHPGSFSSSGNSGYASLESLISLPNGFVEADGRFIEDEDSPFNGYYVPNLTSDIFLMGSSGTLVSLLGQDYVFGGANHIGPPAANGNGGNNSVTVTTNFLPPHVHGVGTLNVPSKAASTVGAHSHSYNYPSFNVHANPGNGSNPIQHLGGAATNTSAAGAHNHTLSLSPSDFAGATGDGGFAGNSISVIPRYLSVKYIIRVK